MEYEIFHTNKNGYILKRLPIYKVGKHLNVSTRRGLNTLRNYVLPPIY